MSEEMLTFSDIEAGKHTFYYSKYPIDKNNVDIDKVMISNQVSFGRNRF